MGQQETFWMACDCTESQRAEYGPFHTREEAELEARSWVQLLATLRTRLGDEGKSKRCAPFSSNCRQPPPGLRRRRESSIPAVRPAAKPRSTRKLGRRRYGPTFTNLNTPAIESAF